MSTREDDIADWHHNGIHYYCSGRVAKGSTWVRECNRPGTIDRFHSHDFDGPLPCDCEEFSQ